MTTSIAQADDFRALHTTGRILILPNAWDAASARLIEECGASAIATTSSGLSWSCGYADGNALPTRVLIAAVAAITRVVRVPVTVDMEAGYSDDPAVVGALAAALIDAGAMGINIEDGSGAPELLAAKIAAVKKASTAAGVDLFVNARVDVFLKGLVAAGDRVTETLSRVQRYRGAGCDGAFVPRLTSPDQIAAIVAAIAPLPLNVMAVPGLASASELQALGVRRLSAGSAIASAAFGGARNLAIGFLSDGNSDNLFGEGVDYAAMNASMPPPRVA